MPTPAIQTLITDAQQVLNLKSLSEIRATMAAALANANVGTPLNPNLTTQQLWDQFYLIVRQPESDIESIITNQLMKFLFAPPAPGGVGANTQVIFNDNGVLAGDAGLTYNKTTDALTVLGNVGVGAVPSAWNNNYNAIDIGANGSIAGRLGASNTVDITSNAFRNSAGDWIYKIATSNPAARYQVDGSTGSHIWYSGAAGTAGNIIAGFSTAAMTLNASGNLVFPSAKGIDFSAVTGGTGTATGNVLNDYEEGTFVPTISGATTAGTGTYSQQIGYYTKVGRLVTVQMYLVWSAHTGTGVMRISGLPFTTANITSGYSSATFGLVDNITLNASAIMTGFTELNSTNINIYQYPSGGGAAPGVSIDTAGGLLCNVSYIAA